MKSLRVKSFCQAIHTTDDEEPSHAEENGEEEFQELPNGEGSEPQKLENFTGVLRDLTVEIADPKAVESLHQQSYFGEHPEGGPLILSPEEVLVLLERKRLQVVGIDNAELNFETLSKLFSEKIADLWIKYLVYRDLRTRGYIVRKGIGDGIEYRVFKRGAKKGEDEAKYRISIVIEGKPVELRVLDKITKYSVSSRKKLVLAVVDRLGEITYYSIDQYNLK
ncbi:MAG: tRNA splicing endonuclease [Promethearchaeota archaeon CR_4]|nr:MAG: tRNA splicing endonuclease [Candidatus Lokiarchaeota archaeon CR_4]